MGTVARGTVFLDANRNTRLDAGEPGVDGMPVSNGREVVVSGADGRYDMPAYDDMNLFIAKRAGYTRVDADLVSQFAYIQKVAVSPALRWSGIEPTGPVPRAINFPLTEDPAGDRFQCMVFGDTQSYTNQEVSFVRDTQGQDAGGEVARHLEALVSDAASCKMPSRCDSSSPHFNPHSLGIERVLQPVRRIGR